MDLSSGRIVPADIFQMQATTRYPGAFYIFQIKSGNEGREFYMRVSSRGSCSTYAGMEMEMKLANFPQSEIKNSVFKIFSLRF